MTEAQQRATYFEERIKMLRLEHAELKQHKTQIRTIRTGGVPVTDKKKLNRTAIYVKYRLDFVKRELTFCRAERVKALKTVRASRRRDWQL
jgi:hypothetical protein